MYAVYKSYFINLCNGGLERDRHKLYIDRKVEVWIIIILAIFNKQ